MGLAWLKVSDSCVTPLPVSDDIMVLFPLSGFSVLASDSDGTAPRFTTEGLGPMTTEAAASCPSVFPVWMDSSTTVCGAAVPSAVECGKMAAERRWDGITLVVALLLLCILLVSFALATMTTASLGFQRVLMFKTICSHGNWVELTRGITQLQHSCVQNPSSVRQ